MASLNHGAVDEPGDDRGELAGRDCNHDLVEQRHALRDLSQMNQGLASAKPAKIQQVWVVEVAADLGGLAKGGARLCGVAPGHALQGGGHQQISLLYAVLVSVEQPPGSGEPPAAGGHFASKKKAES